MKKIICVILALCCILSLGACSKAPVTLKAESKSEVTKATTYYSARQIDSLVKESLGDSILGTDWDDSYYGAIFTADGVTNAYLLNTADWKEICSLLDDYSETLYDLAGKKFDIMLVIVSEIDYDTTLYITVNGNDVTDYLT